jgi:hypothetical protein
MKNNSFILLKEEKERIKKLYEATTASSSGSFETPMGFSVPGLGGDVEVVDLDTTFIDGDNIQDGSVEINLDIEDITDFLNVSEEEDKKRMRKLHRTNSVIEEQIDIPDIPEGCLECAQQSLKGDREVGGMKLGSYDYTEQAEMIMAAIIKGVSGENPSTEELMAILMKLVTTVTPVDVPFIAAGLMGNDCNGRTAFDLCLSNINLYTDTSE